MLEHGMIKTVSSGSPSYSPVTDFFGDSSGKALYRLDGNANDESGNYHGTEGTGITYGGGQYERGAVFDGTVNAKIDTTYTLTNIVTCSAWVNLQSVTYGHDIFTAGTSDANDFRLLFYTSGTLYFDTGGGSNYTNFTYTPTWNAWVHVVAVNNNGVRSVYLNGVSLPRTNDYTGSTAPYGTNLRIGSGYGNTYYNPKGVIDHVRIFNRGITQAEVTALYAEVEPTSTVNDTNPFLDGSCKALYKFENDATDATGVYNGTVVGTPSYQAGKFGNSYLATAQSDKITSAMPTLLYANSWTVNMWVKWNGTGFTTYWSPFQSGDCGFYFNANNMDMVLQNGSTSSVSLYELSSGVDAANFSTIKSNNWCMITLSHIGGTPDLKYYINGTKGTSTYQANGGWARATTTNIGYITSNYTASTAGQIDQLRIFNKALTPLEIASLYNETTPLENPMSHQVDPFKDGSGKALYRLEGNALDESGNYNGTATSVTYGAGQTGRAVILNGGSSYINTGYTMPATSSLSFWVKRTADHGANALIASDTAPVPVIYTAGAGGYIMYSRVTGGIVVDTSSGHIATTLNQWYHVVITDNGSIIKYYKNGVLMSNNASYKSMAGSLINNIGTGGIAGWTADGFIGLLDQLRFFNRALTQAEVTSLYTNQA